MKTTLTLGGIAVVLLIFRFLAKKITKRLEESESKLEQEPYYSENKNFELFKVPTKVEEDLEQDPILKTSDVSDDYNSLQNLTPFNHGTYRGKDGRFKSKKK